MDQEYNYGYTEPPMVNHYLNSVSATPVGYPLADEKPMINGKS